MSPTSLIKVFTPSFADEADTNAQNLTAKEIVARLDPDRFHVTLFHDGQPDARIAGRENTRLWKWKARGNTASALVRMLADVPDIYFFPREGPLDASFFQIRRWLGWHTAVVTYMVSGGLDRIAPRPGQVRNLRAANLVVGNSRHLTSLLESKLGVGAETIHDGIDDRYYFPLESHNGHCRQPLRVLFAGSFRPYKHAEIVVKQAARWPGVEFRLAGTGEEEQRCREMARALDTIHFLGHLNQAQLGAEMRNADVFLFPSELEGHPQVLLQAAGCGLPSIAMKSYCPDAIIDGQTGFLVRGEEELGAKLDLLLNDEELRKRMSHAAAEHATNFTWDKAAADWAKAFEKVVAGRGL